MNLYIMDYKEKATLFKIRNNVIEMLNDRKYNIEPEIKNIDIDQFIASYDNENINFTVDNKIHVYFFQENKSFGKNDLKNIYNKVKEEEGDSIKLIIILKGKCIETIRVELNDIKYKNVEIFSQNQLKFNITKNYLVPKHILLNEEEKQEVFKKYNTKDGKQFQKILKSDPIAKYYGMQKDDMCKIIRPSPSSGICTSYRVVIL